MTFPEMRRKKQALSQRECAEILTANTSGVLSLSGKDGYPYGVPLSYAYSDGRLIFHCGKQGRKIDLIRNNSKASFTIIEKDEVCGEKFVTSYKSVIVFGEIEIIENEREIYPHIMEICKKYSVGFENEAQREYGQFKDKTNILIMNIRHITGKFHD